MTFQKIEAETRSVIALFFTIKGVDFAQQDLFNVFHSEPPLGTGISRPHLAQEGQTQLMRIKL